MLIKSIFIIGENDIINVKHTLKGPLLQSQIHEDIGINTRLKPYID